MTTDKQSQTSLGLLLKTMAGTTDPEVLITQAGALLALAETLNGDQAQTAFSQAVKTMASTTDEAALQSLGFAVQELAKRLPNDVHPNAVRDVRSLLAWSQVSSSALDSATTLATLLSRESAERRASVIVEALKYPTTVGQATDALLKGLQGDGAPGPEAGLDANLSWVAKTYSSIDLDGAPTCPPPPRPGLVCPSPGR